MINSLPFQLTRLSLRKVLLSFSVLGFVPIPCLQAQSDTVQVITHRTNDPSQNQKPYVILISVDGMRFDYARKYHAENLLRLGSQGAVAEYMIPSFPSLTFPNHYTLATGLYPSHHGLVDNMFYDENLRTQYDMHQRNKVEDSIWYGGVPLWVLAEKQKMLTASFYWVGSDALIRGVRPSYYYHYNERIPIERRLAIVKDWLTLPEGERPHLITFYFPEVDHAGHDYGPDSKETEQAVKLVDQSIGKMAAMTDSLHLPVNFIIVADHGMATADADHPITIPSQLLDTTLCKITAGSTQIHVYLKDKNQIPSLYRELAKTPVDFDVFLQDQTPGSWHARKLDDRYKRVGDILLVTHFPKVFKTGSRKITLGKHGFDPSLTEMHATFVAWGPNIKKAMIKPFENVNVYPFVAQLLGLQITNPVDGKLSVLRSILK